VEQQRESRVAETADIAAGRLSPAELAANFADAHPPLTSHEALVEAERCYFCYDAPCMEACPTGIDIPGFIRGIATGNLRGAATKILDANILGGSCARVCPTEVLCEGACVRLAEEERPVRIGALQRRATDWLMEHDGAPFTRAKATGKRIAVVGAGPGGLACAHRLARHGHEVTILEARPKPGGLNEYGIAAYKLADDFAQREVGFVLSIGGIVIDYGKELGRDFHLSELRTQYDAVFLGIGLSGVRALAIEGEILGGVRNAVDFIAELRQAGDKAMLPVGRRVVVIGGGNTAIDAATQARRLGAEDVTIVYRRGAAEMSATHHEQDWAQTNGVRIRHWASPHRLLGENGHVAAVEFVRTKADASGRAVATGETYTIPADMVLKAVGQVFVADPLTRDATLALALDDGRIAVDEARRTSLPGVYAGGDCTAGDDLTVIAVQDGKLAAEAIHRQLQG
jgi:dihydropyrimidine dehydrogenase (NAD+) subunit PreT